MLSAPKDLNSRKKLCHFLLWFFLSNACLFWLIGLRYLIIVLSSPTLFATSFFSYSSFLEKAFVLVFILSSFIGHFALLAFIPCFFLIPLALILNKRFLIFFVAIFIWTASALLLMTDNVIFSLFHFHLNFTILSLIFNQEYGLNKFLELSAREIYLGIFIGFFILFLESIIAFVVWNQIVLKNRWIHFKKILTGLLLCLWISYFIFINAMDKHNNVFAQQTPKFPLYNNILSALLPVKNSFTIISGLSETRFAQNLYPAYSLKYPLHPLEFNTVKKRYNILFIVVDSLRFDAINQTLAPNITDFGNQAWQFRNHYSGGNSTQAGLFSLLYSLPSSYWSSMLKHKRGSLLFRELLKQKYTTKILFSSDMIPPFHKNAFSQIKNLRTTHAFGETIPDRDRAITQEFINFIQEKEKENLPDPFFAFLFYDAPHGYYKKQNIDKIFPTSNVDGQRFLIVHNQAEIDEVHYRYNNAVHFVDEEVQKLLTALKNKHLQENTIVIITGDHGEEFNDTKRRYLGHGSNFSHYQIQTPLIIYWPRADLLDPSKQPKIFTHQTSHYDIVPFLMKNVLGCTNPISDYGIGENLLEPHERPYLLVGSYLNMGIIENQRNITLLTSGDIEIKDLQENILLQANPDMKILSNALLLMRKYYRQH